MNWWEARTGLANPGRCSRRSDFWVERSLKRLNVGFLTLNKRSAVDPWWTAQVRFRDIVRPRFSKPAVNDPPLERPRYETELLNAALAALQADLDVCCT